MKKRNKSTRRRQSRADAIGWREVMGTYTIQPRATQIKILDEVEKLAYKWYGIAIPAKDKKK